MAVDIDKMTNVLVVYNTEDADEVEVRLRMEKIMCARKKIGSGKHGNFLMAMNNFGEEIYVNPEDEAAARAVIEEWRRVKKEEREKAAAEPQPETAEKGNKMLLPRVVAGIALVVIVALYISHLR
ncbi:hypothetical protein [uncultured Eubacterium sp.]|uniref:hypothetical protein n=1 Tax=uncultured Eubacterium sp. TaxID=165185 RepID=UPI0025ED0DD0|nr:hypothetical protein [uncultured Eubacterium sp.]MCI6537311.1 hypothetical protein [Lachnospiraceae bacterium]